MMPKGALRALRWATTGASRWTGGTRQPDDGKPNERSLMSRTTRTSQTFRRNAARDGQGFCCPGGKGCNVCTDNRRVSILRGSLHQREDVLAYVSESAPEPEPTGGVDDYGDCWGTRVGQDPACSCWTCGEVWLSLWSRQDPVWCDRCGTSECVLD